MSYVIHIWQSPVPRDLDHAWEIIEQLGADQEAGGNSIPPALVRLVDRITARYPNWGNLPDDELDDERQVWTDGVVKANGPLLALGISTDWLDQALPFVLEEASRLGLFCYDMQLGMVCGPGLE